MDHYKFTTDNPLYIFAVFFAFTCPALIISMVQLIQLLQVILL